MARTQRQTEYIAMIETGNESQLSAQLLLLSNDAAVVGCTEVLFRPSFSLCCSTCCLRNMRRTTRWLRYGVGDQSTSSTTERDSAQTERALARLVVHSPSPRQPSVSSQKRVAHVIHVLTASHPVLSCSCCTHTTTRVVAELMVAPLGSTAIFHHDH